MGAYGSDGYAIANGPQSLPAYAAFSVQNQQNYTWALNPNDVRALQTSTGRIASTWFSSTSFTFDVNLTDGNTHQVALYALDWDNFQGGRSERIQVLDAATNTVLDTRNIASFQTGLYLVWNVQGHVKINVSVVGGGTSVVSGVFFDKTGASASFVTSDTSAEGTWQNTYGQDGYAIANSTQSVPTYATLAVQNNQSYTWVPNTTDIRALQTTTGSRIASTWYSNTSFSFDLNIRDGATHRIELYALDWDTFQGGRVEQVQIVDATSGTVLDSRTISSFTNGMYLEWNISGHVTINVITEAGNAVISGVFFK